MKGLTRLPLDDDIVDRILIFSPDFVTLNNIILTAKAFYNVYICHPKSITRAVAYNVVGPALPQALRAIRCPVQDQENSNAEPPEDELGDAWDAETGEYGPILPQEVTHLVKNAKAFKGLEENFSLRHKNRRFKDSSQLTFTESYRFQGALYRIMLYCRIFYGPKYVEITDEFVNEDDDEENRDLLDRLNKERKKRKQFLEAYSDEQLLQILSVSRFLKEVFFWAGGSALDPQSDSQATVGDAALSVGPQIIYECLVSQSNDEVNHAFDYWDYEDGDNNAKPFFSGYLSYPINKLFEERKLKPPPEDPSHWKSILDSIEGEKDACTRCNSVKGFDLWGPSTFEYLSSNMYDLEPSRLSARLKGTLSSSRVEQPYFDSLMCKMPSNETLYEYVIQDILGSDYKQPEFEDWRSDDWLCADCVKKLLDENLHLWLLNKRIQAGDNVPSKDCWYGWDCRTQTHKQEHAAKLNHICPPVK